MDLKSALVAANGAATDATVEFTDDGGLHSAAANLAKGELRKGKTLGNPDLSSEIELVARLGTITNPHPPSKKK